MTVLIAFVASPLSLLLNGGDRAWSWPSAITYVVTNLPLGGGFEFRQDSVGTTLAGLPIEVWNGATWTLIYEALCYVAIAVVTAVVPRRLLVGTLCLAWLAMASVAQVGMWITLPKMATDLGTMGGAFCVGAIFWLERDRVPAGGSAATIAGIVFASAALLGFPFSVAPVALAIVIFYLSWRIPVDQIGAHDLSYGVYVWGWPVQQLVMLTLGTSLWPAADLAVVLAATTLLAWASAVVVEEPALRLKQPRSRGSARSPGATSQSPSQRQDPKRAVPPPPDDDVEEPARQRRPLQRPQPPQRKVD